MNFVNFGPKEVKSVMNGTASHGTVFAVLTSQTCGETCWHAREEVCRCSCGGKNHGCLSHGGERPDRTSKIDGHVYKLAAVGNCGDLYSEADRINKEAGFSSIEKPHLVVDSVGQSNATQADYLQAKADGKHVWWQQYKYRWRPTDCGAPARIKTASQSQRKWEELKGWQESRSVFLLWVRVQMPERPKEIAIDENGNPLENQNPE